MMLIAVAVVIASVLKWKGIVLVENESSFKGFGEAGGFDSDGDGQ